MQDFFELSPQGPFTDTYYLYAEYPTEVMEIWEHVRSDVTPSLNNVTKSKLGSRMHEHLIHLTIDCMLEDKMLLRDTKTNTGYRPITNLPFRCTGVSSSEQMRYALAQAKYINNLPLNDKNSHCSYLNFESIPEESADKILGAINEGIQYAKNYKNTNKNNEKMISLNMCFLAFSGEK